MSASLVNILQLMASLAIAIIGGMFAYYKWHQEKKRYKLNIIKDLNFLITEILEGKSLDQKNLDKLNAIALEAWEYLGIPLYSKINTMGTHLRDYIEILGSAVCSEKEKNQAKDKFRNSYSSVLLAASSDLSNWGLLWTRLDDPKTSISELLSI